MYRARATPSFDSAIGVVRDARLPEWHSASGVDLVDEAGRHVSEKIGKLDGSPIEASVPVLHCSDVESVSSPRCEERRLSRLTSSR